VSQEMARLPVRERSVLVRQVSREASTDAWKKNRSRENNYPGGGT